jgi:DDE family transposase
VVVPGRKGHFPEDTHRALLAQVQTLIPPGADVIFLGDGEFDGIGLQAAITGYGWQYVCRTAKNLILRQDDEEFALETLEVEPGERLSLPEVTLRQQNDGPVHALAWWQKGYAEPIYLLTNMELMDEACYWYRKRFCIETFFSDQKSRGFHLHQSHLSEAERLARLMMAACLAYIWIIYLGVLALDEEWRRFVHRTDRCDLSLFWLHPDGCSHHGQLGLRLLDHLLNEGQHIPVQFQMTQ